MASLTTIGVFSAFAISRHLLVGIYVSTGELTFDFGMGSRVEWVVVTI